MAMRFQKAPSIFSDFWHSLQTFDWLITSPTFHLSGPKRSHLECWGLKKKVTYNKNTKYQTKLQMHLKINTRRGLNKTKQDFHKWSDKTKTFSEGIWREGVGRGRKWISQAGSSKGWIWFSPTEEATVKRHSTHKHIHVSFEKTSRKEYKLKGREGLS